MKLNIFILLLIFGLTSCQNQTISEIEKQKTNQTDTLFEGHGLIEEGFASWKGGQAGKSFEESAKLLANELSKNDTVTFLDVLNKKWGWQYAAFYTTGAIFYNSAFNKGGVKLVNGLFIILNDREKLVENLCLLFDIEKIDFDKFWRNETLKFKDI